MKRHSGVSFCLRRTHSSLHCLPAPCPKSWSGVRGLGHPIGMADGRIGRSRLAVPYLLLWAASQSNGNLGFDLPTSQLEPQKPQTPKARLTLSSPRTWELQATGASLAEAVSQPHQLVQSKVCSSHFFKKVNLAS